MKISQLTTENAAEVLCIIAPCLEDILSDEELLTELKTAIKFDNANTYAEKITMVLAKISKFIPILLKKKKMELFTIVAAINGKTFEEVCKQNIITTMMQIREMVKDKELLDFFKSCTGGGESK